MPPTELDAESASAPASSADLAVPVADPPLEPHPPPPREQHADLLPVEPASDEEEEDSELLSDAGAWQPGCLQAICRHPQELAQVASLARRGLADLDILEQVLRHHGGSYPDLLERLNAEREAVTLGMPFAPVELYEYFMLSVDGLGSSLSALLQPRRGDWTLFVRLVSFGFDLCNGAVPQGVGIAFATGARETDQPRDEGRRVRARLAP